MLRYIDHKKMGRGSHSWLDSHFHFSFAEYRNPANTNFGILSGKEKKGIKKS
jgi:hypothetical protein